MKIGDKKFISKLTMSIQLTNFSIVILGKSHNPSILNPDFLRQNKIVDETYIPKKVICTPPVSQVSYAEGISIVAEFERLQFIDQSPERIPDNSPIPDMAGMYVKVLPHVNYTAVGINFSGYLPYENSNTAKFLINDKFIKDGPWIKSQIELPDVSLSFTYSSENGKQTISISTGERRRLKDESTAVINVNSNHHFDNNAKGIDQVLSFISGWRYSFEQYRSLIEQIFPGG